MNKYYYLFQSIFSFDKIFLLVFTTSFTYRELDKLINCKIHLLKVNKLIRISHE